MTNTRGRERSFGVEVKADVSAAMRDGTVLRADVYRPDAPGRYPVLLQRTPYSKDGENCVEQGHKLAEGQRVAGGVGSRCEAPARMWRIGQWWRCPLTSALNC